MTSQKRSGRPKFAKFRVNFPVIREFSSPDRFEPHCIVSHTVRSLRLKAAPPESSRHSRGLAQSHAVSDAQTDGPSPCSVDVGTQVSAREIPVSVRDRQRLGSMQAETGSCLPSSSSAPPRSYGGSVAPATTVTQAIRNFSLCLCRRHETPIPSTP
jgi:hypothetical protein